MVGLFAMSHRAATLQLAEKGTEVTPDFEKALGKRIVGGENPFEPSGSGRAAVQDYHLGQPLPEEKKTEHARQERRRRIMKVFSRLRNMLHTKRDIIGQDPALTKIAENFDKWLNTNKPGASADAEAVTASAEALQESITAFLLSLM
jgi:hypothetical protein